MPKMFAKGLAAALALAAALLSAPGRADDVLRDEFYRNLGRGGTPATPTTSGGQRTALLVTGVIGPGSYEEFRDALNDATPSLVVLDGPGGILGEALLIGEEVRRRGLDTLVGPDGSCASACAVVFLSGHNKYLGSGAAVGLHSASFADGRADPEATALMAAYLSQVGVPGATLRRMALTAPSDIRWLTRAEQKAIGIRAYSGG
jgi:hypothetical protein